MSQPFKVLFAGTPWVAVPALELLINDTERFQVVAVLTRPDAPQGRGRRMTPSPVKKVALEHGIRVLETNPAEPSFPEILADTGAECGAVVAYGQILKQPVLDTLEHGWYNLHFSLLPQWRGAAPVQRALWSGDSITGATVFQLTKGMDEGPIIAQSTIQIGEHETSGELLKRLSEDGSHLLQASLQAVAEGRALPQPQPHGSYEVAKKITTADAHIRFDVPAFAVDRQIRACTPDPGAWCLLHDAQYDEGLTLHILRAVPVTMNGSRPPKPLGVGSIAVTKHSVWVGTRTEPMELLEVKAAGKKQMKAIDWARGARLSEHAYCD